jgi:phosphatidylglycerophosphate synthase
MSEDERALTLGDIRGLPKQTKKRREGGQVQFSLRRLFLGVTLAAIAAALARSAPAWIGLALVSGVLAHTGLRSARWLSNERNRTPAGFRYGCLNIASTFVWLLALYLLLVCVASIAETISVLFNL